MAGRRANRGAPYGWVFEDAGVVRSVLGLLLRWWAIMSLGRFFKVDVTVEKDDEVVPRRPFRVVRHPSYTACLAFVVPVEQ